MSSEVFELNNSKWLFKGIGFRIEDDVLLTETGAEILTANCIRDPEDIELVMDS